MSGCLDEDYFNTGHLLKNLGLSKKRLDQSIYEKMRETKVKLPIAQEKYDKEIVDAIEPSRLGKIQNGSVDEKRTEDHFS